MGIDPGLCRVKTKVLLRGAIGSRNRPLFPKGPRVDVSERGGPRLPSTRDWTAAGEPARLNRRGMRSSPQPTPHCFWSGYRRFSFQEQPEGRSPGGNVGRRVRAQRHRSDRGSGLRAPTPAAIPIAPLHRTAPCEPSRSNRRQMSSFPPLVRPDRSLLPAAGR
jgi:hypothetical protein